MLSKSAYAKRSAGRNRDGEFTKAVNLLGDFAKPSYLGGHGSVTVEVRALTTLAEVNGLRSEWDELVERSATSTIFQTWEWTTTWWRYFGSGDLWILTAREDGLLIGIAPLCISRFPYKAFRCLQIIGESGAGTSIYLNMLALPGSEARCRSVFTSHVLSHADHWDLAELIHLPEDAELLHVEVPVGFHLTRDQEDVCLHTTLPGSWNQYFTSLDKKFRQNISRRRRLVARELGAEIEVVPPGEVAQTIDELIDLHLRRWGDGSLFKTEDADRAFHREIARLFEQRGWLRLFRLRHENRTVAAVYGFLFKSRGYGYLQGFEPSLSRYGLGILLRAHSLEDAVNAGATEFDWLRGQSAYKTRWRVAPRVCYRVVINKRSVSSRVAGGLSRGGFRVFQEMLRLGWADRRNPKERPAWTNSFSIMFGFALVQVARRALVGTSLESE